MNCVLKLFKTVHMPSFAYSYSTLQSELVIFMDNNMVVCWHPEQPFPYEFSKSLPMRKNEISSILKIGNKEVNESFHKINKDLIPYELAAKTYTTKHKWYPRARDKKFNKSTSMDRQYL